jgi:hypothetical protein
MIKYYKYPWKYTKDSRPYNYVKCYDCGLEYGEFPDMILNNNLWEEISPSFDKGCGILCTTCIANRLDYLNKWYELRSVLGNSGHSIFYNESEEI